MAGTASGLPPMSNGSKLKIWRSLSFLKYLLVNENTVRTASSFSKSGMTASIEPRLSK